MTDFPLKRLNFDRLQEAARDGERWGHHHRTYLRRCVERCSLSLPELAESCGYKKTQKFDRRRRRWNEGKGPIPLSYLKTVGVDMDLLRDCIGLDQAEHEVALLKPRSARSFVSRVAAGIYVRVNLPETVAEQEAIECMREHAMGTGFSCLMNYPNLLTIVVTPDGRVIRQSLAPEIRIDGGSVSFGSRNAVGVVGVGR